MASGWNSGSDREAMLRRVAIVLSSLPAPMASKLLGSMGAESKQAVRRTMSTLTDVDPLEHQRAIQAFKFMFERQPTPTAQTPPEGDSLQLQSSSQSGHTTPGSRVVTPAAASPVDSKPAERSPLSFLSDIDERSLAKLLTAEHPQTIAFVLASISPDQAARVLPHLGSKLQVETMSRIGRLGEIPETAIDEVAEHFRSRLQDHSSSDRHGLGRQALDAILAAMPKHEASQTTEAPAPRSASVAGSQTRSGLNRITANTIDSDDRPSHFSAADIPALDLTHRLKAAEQTWPKQFAEMPNHRQNDSASGDRQASSQQAASVGDSSEADAASEDARALAQQTPRPSQSFGSTDGIHQHLIGLSPTELCQALAKVDTRDAMLALCGLPVQVADAALAVLPRAQAKVGPNQDECRLVRFIFARSIGRRSTSPRRL